jgi:hypothetical protein
MIHAYGDNPDTVLAVVFMFTASLLFELIYPRVTVRKLKV